jgi:hypothetical protein
MDLPWNYRRYDTVFVPQFACHSSIPFSTQFVFWIVLHINLNGYVPYSLFHVCRTIHYSLVYVLPILLHMYYICYWSIVSSVVSNVFTFRVIYLARKSVLMVFMTSAHDQRKMLNREPITKLTGKYLQLVIAIQGSLVLEPVVVYETELAFENECLYCLYTIIICQCMYLTNRTYAISPM